MFLQRKGEGGIGEGIDGGGNGGHDCKEGCNQGDGD